MKIGPQHLFQAMWIGWAVYWAAASWNSKPATRRESPISRATHIAPLLLAVLLLAAPALPFVPLQGRLWPAGLVPFWIGAATTAGGLLFAVWARIHLRGNWSGTVTIKEGHEFVSSGPYAIVRHPIYSGLLLALAGTAVALGEWRGALAIGIATAALWRKLRIEERWLAETFGAAYGDYRSRVAALIPFVI